MIASLHGEVLQVLEDSIVLGVGGIGLQVFVPSGLRVQSRPGERLYLHTYLVVRQDALILYGFERDDERTFFTLLLGANGVGPALSAFDSFSHDGRRYPPGSP